MRTIRYYLHRVNVTSRNNILVFLNTVIPARQDNNPYKQKTGPCKRKNVILLTIVTKIQMDEIKIILIFKA